MHPGPSPSEAVGAPPPAQELRFGITVARHLVRRAMARNTVKRVLREAARHAASRLLAAVPRQRLHVVMRLKAPLPDRAAASWSAVKAELRRETDALLEQLLRELVRASSGRRPGPWADSFRASP